MKKTEGVLVIQYDVIIIGAGPGGIFSAFELQRLAPEKKIAVTFNCAWSADDVPQILAVLEKYEAKWLQKNQPNELYRIQEMFTSYEER